MSKKEKTIQHYMSHLPHEVSPTSPIDEVQKIMRDHGIRHLPVKSGLKVLGIISDRDVKFARAAWQNKSTLLKASDIMSEDIFEVNPLTPLSEVAEQMESQKLGSALVRDGDVLVGIFTTTDALRALKNLSE